MPGTLVRSAAQPMDEADDLPGQLLRRRRARGPRTIPYSFCAVGKSIQW